VAKRPQTTQPANLAPSPATSASSPAPSPPVGVTRHFDLHSAFRPPRLVRWKWRMRSRSN